MTLASLEREIIVPELQEATGDKTLKRKHIMEWSTGEIKPHEGETLTRTKSGYYVCWKKEGSKK